MMGRSIALLDPFRAPAIWLTPISARPISDFIKFDSRFVLKTAVELKKSCDWLALAFRSFYHHDLIDDSQYSPSNN